MIEELLNRAAYVFDAIPRRAIGILFPETPKPGDYYWSAYDPIFEPKVRLVDGSWSGNGKLWRRRRKSDDCWEYCQDVETVEEQMDRIA